MKLTKTMLTLQASTMLAAADTEAVFEQLWKAAKERIEATGGLYDTSVNGYAGPNGDKLPRGLSACKTLADYKISPQTSAWQCSQDAYTNFVEDKMAYNPSEEVFASLADFSNVSVSELKALDIGSFTNASATNSVEPRAGKWCGMPGPPNDVNNFWENCVKANGGYFNVAYCDDDGQYAVIGFAAINPDVCYPSHNHNNEEEYWQIGGESIWRSWPDGATEERQQVEGKDFVKRIHYSGMPHEMQTKDGFMLAVYWWAMDLTKGDIDYRWTNEVQSPNSCFFDEDQKKCKTPISSAPRALAGVSLAVAAVAALL